MMNVKATLTIDDATKGFMDELPKKVSASAIFRWAVTVAMTNDIEWRRSCKQRPELIEVTEYLRDRMKKVFV